MTPRLHIDAPLAEGAVVELDGDRAHYLRDVLRLGAGAAAHPFNARDGEFAATLDTVGRRGASLIVGARRRGPAAEPDLWLCFAPIKKTRTDFIVEKATELGASALLPVLTRRTMAERVNTVRLRATATEAAEQTERLSVPEVREPVKLDRLLDAWPAGRRLLVCDETGGGPPIHDALAALDDAARAAPWAALIGPEGGFAREELDRIADVPGVLAVGLGPRILRADTAALAALAVWQSMVGDWRRSTPRLWPDYAASRGNPGS
ncbi:MAG: 16S rRNA (uracil(1498)-N(3))-methyltransferase [Rhodospirillales bacterium]|nr:16S rRNA (uracil(1498)-N(3))-methyltransferase [Rhodospirillales bacterium]